MNSFTETQLDVIRSLCYSHFEKVTPYSPDDWNFEHWEKSRISYADSIVKGLTDPNYWED